MIIRCPSCKGGKKVMGMGMIYRTCQACSGTGQIAPKKEVVIEVIKPLHPGKDLPILFEESSDAKNTSPKEPIESEPAERDPLEPRAPVHAKDSIALSTQKAKPTNNKGSNSNGKETNKK